MKKLNATDALKETIVLLEYRQEQELRILKEQFEITYDSLKPVNIIKNAFKKMATSSDIKGNIIQNVIGMSTGYFTKKLLLGSSHSPVRRILGTVLQFIVTNVTTKHSDNLRS